MTSPVNCKVHNAAYDEDVNATCPLCAADNAPKPPTAEQKSADRSQVKADVAQAKADESGFKTDQKRADEAQDKADVAQQKADAVPKA